MDDSRQTLRRRIRRQRRQLDSHDRAKREGQLIANLARHQAFRTSQRIALFFAADGEPDVTGIIHHPLARRKTFFLPVLVPFSGTPMWFAPYFPGDRLVLNRFGIPEPDRSRRHMISARMLDLVLMPLVGFDEAGNRLGMGGGYYDRSLAFLDRRRHLKKPRLVGTAFELQRVDALPVEPWDVPLDAVATESGVREFGRRD